MGLKVATERVATDAVKGAIARPFLVFICIGILFYVTNPHKTELSIDVASNNVMAEHIAATGSPCVSDPSLIALASPDYFGEVLWMKEGQNCVLNKYPVALALPFIPAFFLWDNFVESFDEDHLIHIRTSSDEIIPVRSSPSEPAVITAAILVALSGWMLYRAAQNFGARKPVALGGAVAMLLTTPIWVVASTAMWTHTSNVFYLAAALWAASSKRWLVAGLFCGLAIMTRPHTALIAAGIGLGGSYSLRDWKPAVKVGLLSLTGVAALMAWNNHYFGKPNLAGGYGDNMSAKLAGSRGWGWFAHNLFLGFFDLKFGLFVVTPAVALLSWFLVKNRRSVDAVALGAAIGGALYLIVQWRMNRASGGAAFYTYRYPIEMLVPFGIASILVFDRLKPDPKRILLMLLGFGALTQIAAIIGFLPKFIDQALL